MKQSQVILVFFCIFVQHRAVISQFYGTKTSRSNYDTSKVQSGYVSERYPSPSLNSRILQTEAPAVQSGFVPRFYDENSKNTNTYIKQSGNRLVNSQRATDVRTLWNALEESPQPNGRAIIDVIAHRSNLERRDIATLYQNTYNQPLQKDIEAKLTGWIRELLLALLKTPTQFYITELRSSLLGAGTDEEALIDIMCTLNNEGMRTVRTAYLQTYGSKLEVDIQEDTSGDFQTLMLALVVGERDETSYVNRAQARIDAQKLYDAGKGQWGTEEPVFIEILTQNNYNQILKIAEEYEQLAGHTLESAIQDEFSGSIRKGLLALLRVAHSVSEFFADRLHESVEGSGTNNKQLIRIVTTRSEVDMDVIKHHFKNKYQISLEDAISDDTTGDYKDCLLAIVGGSVFQQTLRF